MCSVNRVRRSFVLCSVLLFAVTAIGVQKGYAAISSTERRVRLVEGQELNIGIPDQPRRVKRSLPAAPKEDGLEVGPVRFHPVVSQTVEYDDNIKLKQFDEDEDVIFTTTLGAGAEMELGDHRVEGSYGTEIVEFVKDQEQNTVNHLAHGLVELNFNDLHIWLENSFEKSTNRVFSETSERDTLLLNSTQVLVRYDRPKWAAETSYVHNVVDHRQPAVSVNNYQEDFISVLGGYKILPKTLLLAEVDLGTIYYDTNLTNANQDYIQLWGGVRGELSEDFEFTARLGWQGRNLGSVESETGSQTDFDGVVVDIDALYDINKSTTLRAGYFKTVKTSTFGANSWYSQQQAFISLRKRFKEKWFFSPRASWQWNNYPELVSIGTETRERDDHFWQIGAKLEYQIQDWIWTSLRYNFKYRGSDFDTFDYKNNRVAAEVTVAF